MNADSLAQPEGARFASPYRVSQAFNSSLELGKMLDRVTDGVISVTCAQRSFVMLRDEGGGLIFRVARELDRRVIDDPSFQVSRGVVADIEQQEQGIIDCWFSSEAHERLQEAMAKL